MSIVALRILPPFAIGRLGTSKTPLDNYTIHEDQEHPLGYRVVKPAPTLVVNPRTGAISEAVTPRKMKYRDGDNIRPVAPFLEVFAETSDGELVPLTIALLKEHGLSPSDVEWSAEIANRKVVRRTANEKNLVQADTGWFSDHKAQPLEGHCKNFISNEAHIDFGNVRYIKPNKDFPEIRLRFTPAKGLIYGPNKPVADPAIDPKRAIYKANADWVGFHVNVGITPEDGEGFQNETLPPSLYAIEPPAPSWLYLNRAISRGYLDDACDGIISVRLKIGRKQLVADARVCAAPPLFVPDALFVRSLADDMDQIIHGPEIPADEDLDVTRARAEDIVRRAYETVHFMNLGVMNGNSFEGRLNLLLDSMPEEEAADTQRALRPVMSPASVDTLAALALHEQVFAALRAGVSPWFVDLLRRPENVTDYTDKGRRKMPALMCGADNSYLALTHRQINTIRRLSETTQATLDTHMRSDIVGVDNSPLTPMNRSAQVHYAAAGNPVNSRPITSVANCCPGLEVDFRAVWRRMFEGIVLREYDGLVVDIDPDVTDEKIKSLKGHRLLRVAGTPIQGNLLGPSTSDIDGAILLTTNENPYGLGPLEWSNALAYILKDHIGEVIKLDFSKHATWDIPQPLFVKNAQQQRVKNFITRELRVRPFFAGDTAVIDRVLAKPGELTQGLCSPWQNDYRECSCYYWASARPDYVNVEPSDSGLSTGDNWMSKKRTGKYIPDDYKDKRLLDYDDLFEGWERRLRFQVKGRDADNPTSFDD